MKKKLLNFIHRIQRKFRIKFILYLTNQEISLIVQSLIFSLFKKDVVTVGELDTPQFNRLMTILWKIYGVIGNCRLDHIVDENSLTMSISQLLTNFNAAEKLNENESTTIAIKFYGRKTVKLVTESLLYRLFTDKAYLFWGYSDKQIVTDIIQKFSEICNDLDLRGMQINDKIIQEIVDEWTIIKR